MTEVSAAVGKDGSSGGPTLGIMLVIVIAGLIMLRDEIDAWWRRQEEGHRRAALLAAYQKRGRWKARDAMVLRQLGASPVILWRAERAPRIGRPALAKYRPLGEEVMDRINRLRPVVDGHGTSADRRRAILSIPGWEQLAEIISQSLYRNGIVTNGAGLR